MAPTKTPPTKAPQQKQAPTKIQAGNPNAAVIDDLSTVTSTYPTEAGKVLGTVKVAANPGIEYTSSRPLDVISGMIRSLPAYVDDLTRDFGADLYERMMLDPQVSSVVDILRMAALYSGFRLAVSNDVGEEDKVLAQEIVDFCQYNLDNLNRPFPQIMYEMSSGVYLGHKVAEQIYKVDVIAQGKGPQLLLADIRPKPMRSTAFVVDNKNNQLGLISNIFGTFLGTAPVPYTVDATGKIPGLIPRSKFMVFSYDMRDNDPRGSSVLRSVYTEWWMKQQLKPEYLQFLATQAVPTTIGTLPEGAQRVPQLDALGVPTGVEVDPATQMNTALEALRNGGTGVVPFGATVSHLQQNVNDGQVFITAFDFFNQQIAKGVTKQTLATEEAKHMARAASVTHQDVLAMPVEGITANMAECIRRDVLRPLVEYNFGPDAARRLTPDVQSGEVDQQDFATAAHGFAELLTAHAIDMENYDQVSWMLETLGAPALDANVFQQKLDAQTAQAEADAKSKQDALQAMPQSMQDQAGKIATGVAGGQGAGSPPAPDGGKGNPNMLNNKVTGDAALKAQLAAAVGQGTKAQARK